MRAISSLIFYYHRIIGCAVFIVIVTVAALIQALRATRVNPLDALDTAIFGECKWKDIVGTDILYELKRKSGMFRQFVNKHYYLFAKGGFTDDLKETAARSGDVNLITLDEFYKYPG